MIQRQVGSRLNNRDEGLGARIRRMLDDLQNFKIDNPDAQKQMEDMLARLGRDPRPATSGPPSKGSPARPRASTTTRRQRRAGSLEAQRRARRAPSRPAEGRPQNPEAKSSAEPKRQRASHAERAEAAEGRSSEPSGSRRPSKDASEASGGQQAARRRPRRQGAGAASSRERASRDRPDAAGRRRRAEAGAPIPTRTALAEAKTNQKAIADELQKMLDGLSEFETYRGVVKDAQELLKQQEQAMKQTAETRPTSPT